TTYWMVFDPAVRGRVWSVNSYTHDLPRPKMWRKNSVSNYKGGVCRSDDGGNTWRQSNAGMAETAATHILLDPASAPDARTLYVTGFGRGVYKSIDGGKTWALKNTGISQDQPFAWRLARASDGTLYLVIARRSEDGSIGTADDGVDPTDSNVLYASGFESSAWHSTDRGQHWTRIPGFNFKWAHRVIPDPGDRNKVFITTFGGSVWHGAINGPAGPEDIATPELQLDRSHSR